MQSRSLAALLWPATLSLLLLLLALSQCQAEAPAAFSAQDAPAFHLPAKVVKLKQRILAAESPPSAHSKHHLLIQTQEKRHHGSHHHSGHLRLEHLHATKALARQTAELEHQSRVGAGHSALKAAAHTEARHVSEQQHQQAEKQTQEQTETLKNTQTGTQENAQTNSQENTLTNSQENAQKNSQENAQTNSQQNAQSNSQQNAQTGTLANTQQQGNSQSATDTSGQIPGLGSNSNSNSNPSGGSQSQPSGSSPNLSSLMGSGGSNGSPDSVTQTNILNFDFGPDFQAAGTGTGTQNNGLVSNGINALAGSANNGQGTGNQFDNMCITNNNIVSIDNKEQNIIPAPPPPPPNVPPPPTPNQLAPPTPAPTPPLSPEKGCGKTDLVFIVDSSGSIKNPDWDKQVKFAEDVCKYLTDKKKFIAAGGGLRLGIVRFDSNVQLSTEKFTEDLNSCLDGVKKMKDRKPSGTAIHKGLDVAFKFFKDNSDASRNHYYVLFTDGRNNDGSEVVKKAAQNVKDNDTGSQLMAVGVGKNYKEEEIKAVASSPKNVLVFADYQQLQDQFYKIVDEICAQTP